MDPKIKKSPSPSTDPQIERRAVAGPTVVKAPKKSKEKLHDDASVTATVTSATSLVSSKVETEEEENIKTPKAVASSSFWKKSNKDNTVTDGKIMITTQVIAEKEALCCKYSEDFSYMAAGYMNGAIKLYRTSNGTLAFTLIDSDVEDSIAPVTNIKHRPLSKAYPTSNTLTATYANGCVKCWSYNFKQCLYTIKENRQTYGISYHPRFPKFITFGDDQKICFYDEESKIQELVLMPSEIPNAHDGHMSRIFSACFHPRNNYEFISGGWDSIVQFWDLRQPFAVRHITGVHICAEGLDINAKGTEVLTCAYQRSDPLQIFDYGSGKRILCFEPDIHSSKLYCGKYGIKDFIFAGGTEPNILRIVDLQTGTTAASVNYLPGAVYALDLGPKKNLTKKEKESRTRLKSDVCLLPKVLFISGRKMYQADFA